MPGQGLLLAQLHVDQHVGPPEQVFWGGYAGYFADVDCHHREVAFNALWTVRAGGRLSMIAPT